MRISFPSADATKDVKHPLLSGGVSRWLWRVWTQYLTRGGRWFVVVTMVLAAYGGVTLQLQGYVPHAYAMGVWVVAVGAALLYRPRVRVRAEHPDRVCAGETLVVEAEVEQLRRRGGRDLVLMPHRLPEGVDAADAQGVVIPELRRGQRARVRLPLKCRRRGVYRLKGFRVETEFPFGLIRARQSDERETALRVYPQFTRLARLELPAGKRYQPGGVALASNLGESFEFIGNREFREGDNVRDIDWRATARVQRPIVREYREEYFLRVAVILDTHVAKGAKPRAVDAFERAVSVAASVSDYMARQEYLVDIFAAGPTLYHLTAGRSLAYLDQILDILACVESNPEEPFEKIEPELAENLAKISTVICVMLDWNETRRAFVDRLARAGTAPKVIVVRDGPCTIDPAADVGVAGRVTVVESAAWSAGMEEV